MHDALAALSQQLRDKLLNLLGPDEAASLAGEVMSELGLREIRTPDEAYRFGERVMERGGMFAVLGRTIQTHAILRGAKRHKAVTA